MTVIICMVCGLIIGYIYDFFRAIRITSNHNKALTVISDLLFWIITALITILAFFYIDGLNLRFYRFLAIIIGTLLYFIFLSSFFLKISEKIFEIFAYFLKFLFTIIKLCGKIVCVIWNFILYPIKLIYDILKKYTVLLKRNLNKFKRYKKRIWYNCWNLKADYGL